MERQVCLCDCRQCDQISCFPLLWSWYLSCWPYAVPTWKSRSNCDSSSPGSYMFLSYVKYMIFGFSPDRRWARTEMLKIICTIAARNGTWTLNMQLWALPCPCGPFWFKSHLLLNLTELENLKNLSNTLRYTVLDQKGQRFWMTRADFRLSCLVLQQLHFSPPKSSILLHWCRLSPSFSSTPSLPIDLQASI